MFNYKYLLGTILLSTNAILAQQPKIGSVSSKMQQANGDVMSTIQIVRMWVYALISLFIIIRIIFILANSDRGEDKVMKVGGLLAVLIVGAIVVMIAEGVFS